MLVRRLDSIIPFEDPVANVLLGNQLEGGLKEVDVEAQIVINVFEDGKFLLAFSASIQQFPAWHT